MELITIFSTLFAVAVIGGIFWALHRIHGDVKKLYGTRKLSMKQIDMLNKEIDILSKELERLKKETGKN
jgi:uncharacterized small protein (DUF1192 family)